MLINDYSWLGGIDQETCKEEVDEVIKVLGVQFPESAKKWEIGENIPEIVQCIYFPIKLDNTKKILKIVSIKKIGKCKFAIEFPIMKS